MTVKKSTLALATALAACFVGCEWTGTSESDSWSSAYDAMNFSGSYRAVTTATSLSSLSNTTTNATSDTVYSAEEKDVLNFSAGASILAGMTKHANIVKGSFQAASSGGYVWNDDGNGKLVFTDPNSGSTSTEAKPQVVQGATIGTLSNKASQPFDLPGASDIVPSTVVIAAGGITWKDDGNGKLVSSQPASASGEVSYGAGTVTLKFEKTPPTGSVTASYQYQPQSEVSSGKLSGSGTIQYSSGSWTLQINPAMPNTESVTVRYSYNLENSKTEQTTTSLTTTTGNKVTALTVSQSGQNLTITLNNGIVMSGKFTNVQQTGKVNQDTNAGYNTYNAQFQVQTTDNKFVGSLNYDLQNGYRMLNGTWTWGKSSYDVQAVGPAWLNSADQSTLSPGVITK